MADIRKKRRAAMVAAMLVFAGLFAPDACLAHGMRTASLEILEATGGRALVSWKTTLPAPEVHPVFPPNCSIGDASAGASSATDDVGTLVGSRLPASHSRAFTLACEGGLAGQSIAVEGLGPVLSEAIVRVARNDGSVLSQVLTPSRPQWTVPGANPGFDVATQYLRLGVEHILGGADHLLFLFALVLYVRRWKDLLWTETAFTLSHSLSFSATALGWIHVSAVAAEACIALSLVFVALEIDSRSDHRVRSGRQGPVIALVFGLVHGLGFAGALSEIGIPDREVATALICFGIGVEAGQLAFIALVYPFVALARRSGRMPRLATAGSYAVGATGFCWLLQRIPLLEPARALAAAIDSVSFIPTAVAATIGGLS